MRWYVAALMVKSINAWHQRDLHAQELLDWRHGTNWLGESADGSTIRQTQSQKNRGYPPSPMGIFPKRLYTIPLEHRMQPTSQAALPDGLFLPQRTAPDNGSECRPPD